MGVTVNVTISPAKSGWIVELYALLYPDFVRLDTGTTDSAGKTSFKPGASSYPMTLKVKVPSGQIKDDVEYHDAESDSFNCYDGDTKNINLTLTPATFPPPSSTEGTALITSIGLPTELRAGEWITGTIATVKNIGGVEDVIRLLITADWLSKSWHSVWMIPVGESRACSFAEGMVAMPNHDAKFTLEGQHFKSGVGYVIDDTKIH